MKTCRKSLLMLPMLIYISLLPTLEAQGVRVEPEVTGYVGQDVILTCQFIPGPNESKISQVQWDLELPKGEKLTIIVFSYIHNDQSAHDTFLKERVKIHKDHSLIIENVEMRDAGRYTCSIASFPAGSFEGTTSLVVQEQRQLSPGVVSAVVIAVILLLVIVGAITYLIFIRRRNSSIRHQVHVDTSGPVDVTRQSVMKKEEEDVVYSDVKLKPFGDAAPSSNDKHTTATHADDVTYSEVVVWRQQPN